MRITTSMIYGNSLNNIWRNVRHVNDLVKQIETKKLQQRPSDDPIRAARSMRYRTILAETEMYLANANSGMAWMDTSEAAFLNLLFGEDSALQEINTRLVAASDGVHSLDDRRAMVKEMREFFGQIALEMNQTYMGRHVFSGYLTHQPAILNFDMLGRSFVVRQNIGADEIQEARSFQNLPPVGEQPVLHNIHVINLPYRNMDPASMNIANPPAPHPGFQIVSRSIYNDDAYTPPEPAAGPPPEPHVIHYIPETGELIMHKDVAAAFPKDAQITYRVDNLRAGELNPMVYFDTDEIDASGAIIATYNTADNDIRMEMAASNHITINSLARDIFTPAMYSDLLALFEFVENLQPSDRREVEAYFKSVEGLTGPVLEERVNRFMSDEEARMKDVLHTRFSTMLGEFKRHSDVVQREHANLGSRMNQLDMIITRLEEEDINYTALLSANEDTPLEKAILRKTAAEAAYNAALRANAMTVQLSLVNFLR